MLLFLKLFHDLQAGCGRRIALRDHLRPRPAIRIRRGVRAEGWMISPCPVMRPVFCWQVRTAARDQLNPMDTPAKMPNPSPDSMAAGCCPLLVE